MLSVSPTAADPTAIAGMSAETVSIATKDKTTVVTLPSDSVFGAILGKSEIDLNADGPTVLKGTNRSFSCVIDQ